MLTCVNVLRCSIAIALQRNVRVGSKPAGFALPGECLLFLRKQTTQANIQVGSYVPLIGINQCQHRRFFENLDFGAGFVKTFGDTVIITC